MPQRQSAFLRSHGYRETLPSERLSFRLIAIDQVFRLGRSIFQPVPIWHFQPHWPGEHPLILISSFVANWLFPEPGPKKMLTRVIETESKSGIG